MTYAVYEKIENEDLMVEEHSTGGKVMIAPAAKAHIVLIVRMTKSPVVAYRKRLVNRALSSGKLTCSSKISFSSCLNGQ
jgi:hypothetical protein